MDTRTIVTLLGGPTAVARHCGVRPQAVSQWMAQNRIPAERVPDLEGLAKNIGAAVRAEQMRPDIKWCHLRDSEMVLT